MINTLLLRGALPLALLSGLASTAHAITLAPQYAGDYRNGDGANSKWVQVNEDWRGPTNGTETWGTGIWSLADQAVVLNLNAGDPAVTQTLQTRVDQINFADQTFQQSGQAKWGATTLAAPIFSNAAGEYQDNWASRFTGYLSITTPGDYNLGVLYDDGFRLSLTGANGTVGLEKDGLNFPDRLGFDENLQLSNGLYGFQLDAYERLEAGVIQLSWITPSAPDWTVIPKQNLFTTPVPEPSLSLLMLAGVGLVGWRALMRR